MLHVLLVFLIVICSCAAKQPEIATEQISVEEEQKTDIELELGKLDTFLTAYNLYKNGNYEEAKPLFSALAFDEKFPLQIYAAWHLGLIELDGKNAEGVLKAIEQSFRYEPGPLEAEFLFLLGWAYLELEQPQRAIEIYQTLEKKYPSTNAALRKFRATQALVALGENKRAGELLLEIELLNYGSAWLRDAKKLKSDIEREGIKTAVPYSLVEQAFEMRTKYADWDELYSLSKWYSDRCEGFGCDMARYYRARALEGNGKWKEAEKIYLELASGKGYGNLALWRLFLRAQEEGNTGLAISRTNLLTKRYPQSELGSRAYFWLASDYHSKGCFVKEIEFLRKALALGNVWRKDEVLWRAGWSYYRQNNFERAKINWEYALKYTKDLDQRSKIFFWLWRVTGDASYLNKLPRSSPPSYYLLLAHAMAEQPYEIEIAAAPDISDFSELTIDEAFRFLAEESKCNRIEMWNALFSLKLFELLRSELKWIEKNLDDNFSRYALAQTYRTLEAYSDAVKISGKLFYSGFPLTRELWELCFPIAYLDIIESAAQKYELDPVFVLSVMRQESMFDPSAVSSANAKGLMQIIPPTGKFLFKQLGLSDFDSELLYEPNLSIELGCYYLSSLKRQFGKIVPALCAYNAGEARVVKWKPRFEGLACYEAIEEIPFQETRTYVQRILRNWEIYRQLYGNAANSILPELLNRNCF